MKHNQRQVSNGEPARQFDSVMPGVVTLLNERQAARVLGVSPRTLWGLAARGEVPFVRVGKTAKRYDPNDLRAYCERNRVTSTPAVSAPQDPADNHFIRVNHGGHHG